jgi:hypothetical protein
MAPIPLSETQWDLVYGTTRLLPEEARAEFVRELAAILDGGPVGDGQLWRTIRELQRRFWKPPPPERSWVNAHTRRRVGEPLL